MLHLINELFRRVWTTNVLPRRLLRQGLCSDSVEIKRKKFRKHPLKTLEPKDSKVLNTIFESANSSGI